VKDSKRGSTMPTELMRAQKKRPGVAKAGQRVCVLSLAAFLERPQAGTNQRWPAVYGTAE
jgi:hypothetical protein